MQQDAQNCTVNRKARATDPHPARPSTRTSLGAHKRRNKLDHRNARPTIPVCLVVAICRSS
eukprot:11525909-Alexandrium_andersonii.AAC.1